jgi:orotate phosphoribosyltransferase
MTVEVSDGRMVNALVEWHCALYDGPEIDPKLNAVIRDNSTSKLSDWDIHRILRTAKAVYFDTHVEVVSGHHTATYLRFDSIVACSPLIRLIARDMADWIMRRYRNGQIAGIVSTASGAEFLAEAVADIVRPHMRLSVVLTPYDSVSGRIGTEVATGTIHQGDQYLVLNDATTRGNCVNKLAQVVTDHKGIVAGMMVFARRDSGQFPLVDELVNKYPFYYTADLDMPQWEPKDCPLCKEGKPLLKWNEIPEI